jgi:hypothetical protein
MRNAGGRIVIYILIALGVVVVLWIVSLVIQKSDKKSREEYIKMKLEQRKREEEAKEKANRPSFL